MKKYINHKAGPDGGPPAPPDDAPEGPSSPAPIVTYVALEKGWAFFLNAMY
jgi:hypothetical protein